MRVFLILWKGDFVGTREIVELNKQRSKVEQERKEREKSRKEDIRYWVTTAIAAAALVKSFFPEIAAGLEWLSKLLGQ